LADCGRAYRILQDRIYTAKAWVTELDGIYKISSGLGEDYNNPYILAGYTYLLEFEPALHYPLIL